MSGAVLGAQPAEVVVSSPSVSVEDTWLLDTDPAKDSLVVDVTVLVSRDQPEGEERDIPFRFEVLMVEDGGGPLAGSATETVTVPVPRVVTDMPVAVTLSITPEMILTEENGYILRIAVSHDDDPPSGVFQTDHALDHGPHEIVHFSGET